MKERAKSIFVENNNHGRNLKRIERAERKGRRGRKKDRQKGSSDECNRITGHCYLPISPHSSKGCPELLPGTTTSYGRRRRGAHEKSVIIPRTCFQLLQLHYIKAQDMLQECVYQEKPHANGLGGKKIGTESTSGEGN